LLSAVFPVNKLRKAEQILMNHKLLNPRLKPVYLENSVFFPLSEIPSSRIKSLIEKLNGRIEKVDEKFFPRKKRSLSLKELEKRHKIVFPKSVSLIGDILLINEIPEEAVAKRNLIGEILRENFAVRAVFLKVKEISGETRVAQWERIAGFGGTFTVHKENNYYYALDISKVFFNPRMGSERARIIKLCRRQEMIIDMFSGVGPFAIPIAAKCAVVYAIDINKHAIDYLLLNAEINNVSKKKIIAIHGDSRTEVPKINVKVDRIIMNYPERAISFLDVAISALKKEGGFIHLYFFLRERNKKTAIESSRKLLEEILKDYTIEFEIRKIIIVREVAPRKYLLVADMFVKRRYDLTE